MTDREEVRRRDAEDLRRLGYGQQLLREMGGFSNFAVSFSIISILTGAVLLFGYGLKLAGPIVNTAGWPLVSVFTLAIAAAMAQLASAYPTAGGLYFWAYRLGGRTWAWWTAWANMIGQVTITAGINVAAAIYAIGAAVRIFGLPESAELPFLGPLTSWRFELVVMVLLMVPQVLLNVYGIRAVARLNDFSVWWHIAGGAVIVALLLFFGRHHNGLAFLLRSGGPVTPLEASSAKLADGSFRPALV
ncbi:MAG TPA: amino acid permease, partial [Thermoanaerobaculia bacterium]|nr:amino acid permease [Thermoanaerobaculia bacterium]